MRVFPHPCEYLLINFRLEIESSKLRNCKNQEEIDDCKDRIETLQKEIETKR